MTPDKRIMLFALCLIVLVICSSLWSVWLGNPPETGSGLKSVTVILIIVVVVVLRLNDKMEDQTVSALLGGILGYILGNSVCD